MRPVTPGKTFMGNPCARGHDGKRYSCNGACVHCTAENAARRKNKAIVEGAAAPAKDPQSYGGSD